MVVHRRVVGQRVCKHGSVETPYLGITFPPLLGVLLVLLQSGPGLPFQAAHLPLVLLDQAVLFRAILLLQPRPLLLVLHALLSHLIGQAGKERLHQPTHTQSNPVVMTTCPSTHPCFLNSVASARTLHPNTHVPNQFGAIGKMVGKRSKSFSASSHCQRTT